MGKKTKIDWCESSFNPISGCRHGCDYCYARGIANRFSGFDKAEPENRRSYAITGYNGQNIYEVTRPMTRIAKNGKTTSSPYPFGFVPTLHEYKLNELEEWKTPKRIFVCSMADLFGDFIPDEWIEKVFEVCEKAPQHTYLFLTKNPKRYKELFESGKMPKNLKNKWFGTTVTKPEREYFYLNADNATDTNYGYHDFNGFLSIEPIQADFRATVYLRENGIKWIIVGAETGNHIDKIIPEKAWIEHIAETCKQNEIPIFMKDSLRDLMGDDFIQEFP